MTPAFVGFIVAALVGGAAEMASAFSAARKNRMDLSVSIGLGAASQIAFFVAPDAGAPQQGARRNDYQVEADKEGDWSAATLGAPRVETGHRSGFGSPGGFFTAASTVGGLSSNEADESLCALS
jgi:hypothetical protein